VGGRAEELSGIHRLERPGFLEFEGIQMRGARDLSHLSDGTLRAMENRGFAATDINGEPLVLHHLYQSPDGPLVEIPASQHNIGNDIQHPYGNTAGMGLTAEERAAFNEWRTDYWKARATEELVRRGLR